MKDEKNDLNRRTKRYSLDVIKLFVSLPKSEVGKVLGRQMLRSATSVGAQYREANRGKSIPDFISKIEGACDHSKVGQTKKNEDANVPIVRVNFIPHPSAFILCSQSFILFTPNGRLPLPSPR